jgi:hypothetical protein
VSSRACAFVILVAISGASMTFAGMDDLRIRADVDYTWDDNVPRATTDQKLSDSFATLALGANLPLELTPHSRLVLNATLGGQAYVRYTGLNQVALDVRGEWQYRSSAQYTTPTWSVFVHERVDWFDSDLRDGYRTSFGVSVRKPITDRIGAFAAVAFNVGNAQSDVFDTRNVSVRGMLDYLLSRRNSLYLGLEYRDGHSVSTMLPSPAFRSIAQARVLDDVFTDPQRTDYRFDARTGILTLGYNFAITERQALDVSYRGVYSKPKEQPDSSLTTSTVYYVDNQITVSYLIRF